MCNSKFHPLAFRVCITFFLIGVVACGGGGGGGSSDVRFFGTVREVISGDGTTQAGGVINICALGECDVTNDLGQWTFAVDDGDYAGGNVVFELNGPNVAGQATVLNLSDDVESVEIVFVVQEDGTIVVQSVAQDQAPSDEETPAPPAEEENEPLPVDPQAKACEIIRRSNITITDVKTPIIHQASDSCPKEIDTIIAVGNIHAIAFEYEVTADTVDLSFDPIVDTAAQGELNRHDASYSCLPTETFVANITARITRYLPAGEAPLTRDEAIALCGSNAHVGNTEDTVQIVLDVQS